MSVEQLKIDAIDAAQKYKARYKQTLDPNDLDMFKRFMDVYNHLDGSGGVDSIIAGNNISISPVSGTGDVTINADTTTTVRTLDAYTASEGQTDFTITAANFDFVDVYINGARLIESEYTIASNIVTLNVAAELDDEINLISYYTASISSAPTIRTLTQAEYEALAYINPNILYVITDDVV